MDAKEDKTEEANDSEEKGLKMGPSETTKEAGYSQAEPAEEGLEEMLDNLYPSVSNANNSTITHMQGHEMDAMEEAI